MSDINEIKRPKAIKDHKCDQCELKIPKGNTYIYHHGLFEGSFFVNKMHRECFHEWGKLNSDAYGDDWFPLRDWHLEKQFNFNSHQDFIKVKYNLKD